MSEDFNLRDYILKQRETYSLDDIEAGLLEQGFDETMVKNAVAELRSSDGPEIPVIPGGGGSSESEVRGDRIKLTLYEALPNGIHALTRPGDFFARMEQEGGLVAPMYTILFWAVASSLVMALADFRTTGSALSLIGFAINIAFGMIPASILSAMPTMIYTILFYFLCSVNGGSGSFEGSFRAVSCLNPLLPIFVLAWNFFPFGIILILPYGLLLSVYAGVGVHGLTWWRSFFSHAVFLIGGIGWLVYSLMS